MAPKHGQPLRSPPVLHLFIAQAALSCWEGKLDRGLLPLPELFLMLLGHPAFLLATLCGLRDVLLDGVDRHEAPDVDPHRP